MAYHQPGEASPSFAQTGAELDLDDSSSGADDLFDYDDEEEEALDDLHSEVGGEEAYEMRSPMQAATSRDGSRSRLDSGDEDIGGSRRMRGASKKKKRRRRRQSASTVASFQLYTPDEELAVRRKFDRKLVLFVTLLFLLSFLDRSNIGNARIAGMEEDLQTDPPRDDWYEWALTGFYISYIGFEWMSLLFKVVPAHILISMVVLTWGLTASLQAIATSYPMLVALRVILGIGEAGFTGIPFYMSFFFKRQELAFRVAIFISAAPLATAFASTIAWAIVKFAQLGPIAPWRLLFLVEGFPSVIVAAIAWSVIPDSPQTASYLTTREKKIARLRLRNEKPSAAASSSSPTSPSNKPASGLRIREVLAIFRDPVAWVTASMFFLTNMAYSSLPVFLPKIMTEMGHSRLAAQALSAPPYLVAFIIVLFTAHMSDRIGARTVPIVFHALSSAGGYAVLALAGPLHLPAVIRYIAIYPAAVGFFNVVTLTIAWNINNQTSESRQGGGFALMQLIGQFGPLVGTRLYPDRDAPYYTRGMAACAFAMLAVALLALFLRIYLQYQNRKMDAAEADPYYGNGSAVEEESLVAPSRRRSIVAPTFRYLL